MIRPSSGAEDPALGMLSVLREDGRTDPATDPFLSTETLLSLYHDMCRLREVDRALVELQRSGKVAFHSSAGGQEAVVIGAAAAIAASDWVFPAAREGEIFAEVAEEICAALAQAEVEAGPAMASLFEDVYAELPWHLVEQSEELISLRDREGSVL